MPELPEVETIRRELARELPGRRITEVRVAQGDIVMTPSSVRAFREGLRGHRITAVGRRAKYLLFDLSGPRVLQTQLRMTGRFTLGEEAPDAEVYGHVAAEFELDDGRTLSYDDVRRLGGFRLLPVETWRREEAGLGPEPLSEAFDRDTLVAALAGSRAPVKNALLDQGRIAGVGNIYASESLHGAALDPRRPAGELGAAEVGRLHGALRAVLSDALDAAGTTLRDYRAVDGRSGRYQERLRVYGREGEACPRCGDPVQRIVQAGRSTFFCPGCQE